MPKPMPAVPLRTVVADALTEIVARSRWPGVVAATSSARLLSRSVGCCWRIPGLIVTADEPLDDEGEIAVVLPGGETAPATLVGQDPTTDIALLRVRSHQYPAGRARIPIVGDECSLHGPSARCMAHRSPAFGTVSFVGGSLAQLSRRRDRRKNRTRSFIASRRGRWCGARCVCPTFGMAVLGPQGTGSRHSQAATIERVAARLGNSRKSGSRLPWAWPSANQPRRRRRTRCHGDECRSEWTGRGPPGFGKDIDPSVERQGDSRRENALASPRPRHRGNYYQANLAARR